MRPSKKCKDLLLDKGTGMRLHYELENAGWASVTVECGDQRVEISASYLHDSLRDLASAARALSIIPGDRSIPTIFAPSAASFRVL